MRAMLIGFLSVLGPCLAMAHGLLLDAESDGRTITGTAYYSNGERAANEAVSLLDLAAPSAAPRSGQTDAQGYFSFTTAPGHQYRVAVHGEEGHSVELELAAQARARPVLVDNDAGAPQVSTFPPAWALIGGLLLLSLVPAMMLRKPGGLVARAPARQGCQR